MTSPETVSPKPASDWLAAGLVLGLIFAATLFQKFAVPLGGGQVLYFSLVVLLGVTGLGIVTHRLTLQPQQTALLLFMMATLIITQVAGGQAFSPTSLAMLLVTHLAYAFKLRPGLVSIHQALLLFQKTMVLLALLGIAQFTLQFVIGSHWAFFLDTQFPAALIVPGFNSLNELAYGSIILKANGVFMLEPSLLCQFLAVAMIIELVYFRNLYRLGLIGGGILLTFSGTGLLILFILGPIYLIHKRHFIIFIAALVAILTAGLWAPEVGLGPTYARIFEFTNPQSSGYARFLGIFPTLQEHVLSSAQNFFFGRGAGAISPIVEYTGFDYMTHNPSWGKVMFEYGLIGLLAYLIFFLTLIIKSPVSGYVKAALALQFFFLGEYLLPPILHAAILALLIWPSSPSSPQGSPT